MIAEVSAIIDENMPLICNLANISAVLNTMPDINWCGFYLEKDGDLYLGPFQGEPACTYIPCGKGVCGSAMKLGRTLVVDDVTKFPGHIACSEKSRSEIVVPIKVGGKVKAVIDIDSPSYSRFTPEDKKEIEAIAEEVAKRCYSTHCE